ncbi:transglutaminase-like superfamily protein [Mycobacterium xenopi 3993]|nr:transglutaminase-like superfamily protein [Mycobacterium xenopi 3993]
MSLTLLRSMGIPARYVSGYLHPDRDGVVGRRWTGKVTRGSRRGPGLVGL